ncbi:RagB/SusD family nutrient uptake outer membrane protein [uncultured Acetobacteroides sp.]|uniref:RagB/SusD family nutrient uptake outer membrane protein n=1 Tax=uncultured Acetobacteroides sp. TaxID=1760811 RepID=UPI0029F47345|nr:RagB/SusD family nutrient uptake outer membrane protein [uncultured Acetobacteroides sp.]
MKSSTIFHIAFVLGTLVGTTSCESFLDREPTMTISNNEITKDLEGLNFAVVGDYSNIMDTYGSALIAYSESRSGNLQMAKSATSALVKDITPSYEFSNLYDDEDDAVMFFYENFYKIINQANDIIEACKTRTYANTKLRDQYYGEALFMRALSHFNLCNLYAQPYSYSKIGSHQSIVMMDKKIPVLDYPVRSKLYVVYDLIISDLKKADTLLTNNSRTTGIKQAWISQAAVQALLARVLLYKGDYKNAYYYSNKVIADYGYSLVPNKDYLGAWSSTVPNQEDIWIIDFTAKTTRTVSTYYGVPDVEKTVACSVSKDLYSLYENDDVRKSLIIPFPGDARDTVTIKFKSIGLKERYIPAIRLSEMYLTRAEAAAELSDVITARNDLNTIRQRANVNATPIYPSGQALIDAIMLERRKELAFEGHTYYDFIRKGKGITRTYFNGINNKDVPFPSDKLILPFPKNAVERNPNLNSK